MPDASIHCGCGALHARLKSAPATFGRSVVVDDAVRVLLGYFRGFDPIRQRPHFLCDAKQPVRKRNTPVNCAQSVVLSSQYIPHGRTSLMILFGYF